MHELSIALSIIELAEETSAQHGGAGVCAVHLKLGPLSGVVKSALLASFELACEGTLLTGSSLVIEDVPLIGYCPACRGEQPIRSIQAIVCATCGTACTRVVRGDELEVFAMELDA